MKVIESYHWNARPRNAFILDMGFMIHYYLNHTLSSHETFEQYHIYSNGIIVISLITVFP